MKLILVGCGKKKKKEYLDKQKYKAKNLYTSKYFKLKRKYAEQYGDLWYILSAKHGIVPPEKLIEPYDLRLSKNGFKGDDSTRYDSPNHWGENIVNTISNLNDHRQCNNDPCIRTITILAGKNYLAQIQDRLKQTQIDIHLPFESTSGMFDQMNWLAENIDKDSTASPQKTLNNFE